MSTCERRQDLGLNASHLIPYVFPLVFLPFPSAFIEFVFFPFVIFTLFKRVATFVCQRVLQHWTMVKLVLLQIVADVFVDVGHILGATADTMLDTE